VESFHFSSKTKCGLFSFKKKKKKLEKTKAMPCQFPGNDLSKSLWQCAQAKNGTYALPDQNK
jgi:hypothetical protein